MSTSASPELTEQQRESRVLLFLTFVLAPIVSVAFVGGYGFLVWIFQMFAGPPGGH